MQRLPGDVAARRLAQHTDDGGDIIRHAFAADRRHGLNAAAGRRRALAADLAKRGWSATRIDKILGGNFARLFAEVWGE